MRFFAATVLAMLIGHTEAARPSEPGLGYLCVRTFNFLVCKSLDDNKVTHELKIPANALGWASASRMDDHNIFFGDLKHTFSFDPEKGTARKLFDFYVVPQHSAALRKVLYWRRDVGKGRLGGIYLADPDGSNVERIVDHETPGAFVIIDGDRVAFRHPANESLVVYLLDVKTRTISDSGAKGCRPVFWRNADKRIFCSDITARTYFWLDLDTKTTEPFAAIRRRFQPVLYVAEIDTMFFVTDASNLFNLERTSISSYSFRTGQTQVIFPDGGFGPGQAFWLSSKAKFPAEPP